MAGKERDGARGGDDEITHSGLGIYWKTNKKNKKKERNGATSRRRFPKNTNRTN